MNALGAKAQISMTKQDAQRKMHESVVVQSYRKRSQSLLPSIELVTCVLNLSKGSQQESLQAWDLGLVVGDGSSVIRGPCQASLA